MPLIQLYEYAHVLFRFGSGGKRRITQLEILYLAHSVSSATQFKDMRAWHSREVSDFSIIQVLGRVAYRYILQNDDSIWCMPIVKDLSFSQFDGLLLGRV